MGMPCPLSTECLYKVEGCSPWNSEQAVPYERAQNRTEVTCSRANSGLSNLKS